MRDTVILGAGLAGMSVAYHLRGGYELFEREDHPGGLVVTQHRDGFHFDVTGHWLHMRDRGIRRTVNRLMKGRMVQVLRDSRIFSKGVYTLYPFQTNTFGLPVETVKEIISGFVEAVYNKPGAAEEKTFEQWVLKYMGRGIAEHFMIPYNEKLWCTHPRDMTPLWCRHYVPKPTLDQILDGALRHPEERIGYNASFSYPERGGIGELSKALATALNPAHIHFRVRPGKILARKRMVELPGGETVGYRRLVSTIPLPELLRLIVDAPVSVRDAVARLVHNQVYYYNIALDCKAQTPAHWVYFPERSFLFYRAGCYSNAVRSMAPGGRSSLYVEISHRGGLPPEKSLWKRVARDLIDARIVKSPDDIRFYEARNIPYAYVVFDHNYQKSLKTIHPWLNRYGIFSIGRYGRWTYNSMESALIDGREIARRIRDER